MTTIGGASTIDGSGILGSDGEAALRSLGIDLLGILRVDDCVAAQILVTTGIGLDELRERVVARLGQVA